MSLIPTEPFDDLPPPSGGGESPASRREAVARLFREHNRGLVRFLEGRLRNEQEAREVAQEAYVRLLQLERTGSVSFLRGYLYKIAANLAVDRIRTESAHRRIDAMDAAEDIVDPALVERSASSAEEMALFWASLQELPEHYRRAFVMNRLQDCSTNEIAEVMGKTDRMVRRYIVSALTYCRYRVNGLTAEQARQRMDNE